MKIFATILGFILGIILGIVMLAAISTMTNSKSIMDNTFVFANIFGIVGAIIGYNMAGKSKR